MKLRLPKPARLPHIGALVAVLALFASGCGQQAKLPPLAVDAVVLAFGDSLTFGSGANEQESYPAQLAGLIGTPEPGFTVTPPGFYAEIANEFRVPYEGDALTKILRDSSLKSDQVHPNARGYRLLAERVADLLRKSGAL